MCPETLCMLLLFGINMLCVNVLCVSEISRVRKDMYIDTLNGSERISELPDAIGPNVQLQEKLYVPTKEHPDVSVCEFTWSAGNINELLSDQFN